jgi:NAD+ kinase
MVKTPRKSKTGLPAGRSVALVYNADKPRARHEWLRLRRWLEQHKVKVIAASKVTPGMKNADFVVAVGGDGTVLSTARQTAAWGVPVLGVNVGRLGFLAATEVGAMFRTLSRVLAGEGRVEARTLLSVTGTRKGKKFGPYLALNDCVVRSGSSGRVLQVEATVRNRTLASYAGDGLIISTPTGSTAYNLAASGPIVYPDLDVFLLCPICPHSLVQRPLVMPTFEIVGVEVLRPSPPALLCVDGFVLQTLHPGDRIRVQRAAEQAKLLMDPDRTYYQVLQSKLKWGGS